ncbi:mannose-1-phosphate guanylyltransferase [bacterium]|nr:mannose-1-phosphate guanylyltransferase [bacterium]
MIHAAILAGGRGQRLWPKSRKSLPKHLLPLIGEKTMIQETVGRLKGVAPEENIYIVTEEGQQEIIAGQLPDVPGSNILIEPEGRNTAASIGLAAVHMEKKDPDGVMISLHSDNWVGDVETFRRILRDSCEVAERTGGLGTVGIAPTYAATGFGYIHTGRKLDVDLATTFWEGRKFVEKPDLATAERYVSSGEYFWNGGMFIWRISSILDAIRQHMPDLYEGCRAIRDSLGSDSEKEEVARVYGGLEKVPIDRGVMEKADNIFVAKGDFPWDDVGTWASIENHFPADAKGNVVIGEFEEVDSENCIIVGDETLITTVGVSNLIVVKTKDALLICRKERAEEVRDLVAKLADSDKFRKHL